MHLAVARRLPRLLPLAVAVALLGAGLVLAAGDPAAAQAAPSKVTIKGTAENKWDPADATVKPGGTVTFDPAPPPLWITSGRLESGTLELAQEHLAPPVAAYVPASMSTPTL